MSVNALKKLQMELLHERERYSILLSMNTNCFFEYDVNGDFIVFTKNKVIPQWSGKVIGDCSKQLGKEDCIYREDVEKLLAFFKQNKDASLEFRVMDEHGEIRWCSAKGASVGGKDSNLRTFNGCISDIDLYKKEQKRKEREAKQDHLTKLLNKEYTRCGIEDFISGEGKEGSHGFMILDIDNFKKINEKLGKLFGDAVLTNLADNLRKIFYPTDIVGRIGGDKFLVFLKNTDNMTILKERAEYIKNVCMSTYTGEDKELRITCSMGITRYPVDGCTYETLFKKADAALYEAKGKGKGYSVLYDKQNIPEMCLKNKEYFNRYHSENSISWEKEELDYEFSNFAFGIMSKTADVSSAMNILLDQIGKKFDVSYVYVIEAVNTEQQLRISYLWDCKRGINPLEQVKKNAYLKEKMHERYFNERGMLAISNVKENQTSEKPILVDICNNSVLQCGFYDSGEWKNFLGLEDERVRTWTSSELDSIQTITRIISFYLYKLRISEEIEAKLELMKNYDALTGLPTLYKFKRDVRRTIALHPNKKFAIIYSDISGFKYLNDTYGYGAGDRLLCDFADYLNASISELVHVGRVSADIFIVLIPCEKEEDVIDSITKRNEKFQLLQMEKSGHHNLIVISGACVIQEGENDILSAIDNANIARKRAKGSNRPICRCYDAQLAADIKKEQDITNSMEKALKNKEFKIFLQPKLDVQKNLLAGAEALIRWKKDGKILPPSDFISLFEKNGFIVKLDFYVYEAVCKLLKHWLIEKMPIVPVSVNVSRIHLNEQNFAKKVKALVDKYEIPYELLEMELTESIFLNNTDIALTTMKELRAYGFGVSIDDFGAGYSSLNLLKDMTTDVLKLDKEFFRQGEMKEEEQIIVSSIIGMAKKLNMKVLSEGVETKTQYDFLKKIDCDFVQGYLYAKPMPVHEFELLLRQWDKPQMSV